MECEKKKFNSEKSANEAAKIYANMRGCNRKKQRAYYCAACKSWHLTSQEKEKERRRNPEKKQKYKNNFRDYYAGAE